MHGRRAIIFFSETGYPRAYRGLKRPEREVDHSPLPSAEFREMWSFNSTPLTSSFYDA